MHPYSKLNVILDFCCSLLINLQFLSLWLMKAFLRKINTFTIDKCSMVRVWWFFLLVTFQFLMRPNLANPPSSILMHLLQIVYSALSGSLAFLSHTNCFSHFTEYEVLNIDIFLIFYCLIIWSKTKQIHISFLLKTPIISLIWAMEQYIPLWTRWFGSNPKGLYDILDFRILEK